MNIEKRVIMGKKRIEVVISSLFVMLSHNVLAETNFSIDKSTKGVNIIRADGESKFTKKERNVLKEFTVNSDKGVSSVEKVQDDTSPVSLQYDNVVLPNKNVVSSQVQLEVARMLGDAKRAIAEKHGDIAIINIGIILSYPDNASTEQAMLIHGDAWSLLGSNDRAIEEYAKYIEKYNDSKDVLTVKDKVALLSSSGKKESSSSDVLATIKVDTEQGIKDRKEARDVKIVDIVRVSEEVKVVEGAVLVTPVPDLKSTLSTMTVDQIDEELTKISALLRSGSGEEASLALGKLLLLPSNSRTEQLQALMGVAREVSGEYKKALVEYQLYLNLYPNVDWSVLGTTLLPS